MIIVDLFREEFAFGEYYLADGWIVGLADGFSHVGRLEDGAILVEEALIVSKMIRVHCGATQFWSSCDTALNTYPRNSCRHTEDLEDLGLLAQNGRRP